ncbi:MAG: antitoxin [Intrasporangium sp.]|uniref:antitoxin n=1 Tax=Intrasporangium sp. TaxID=1925024 RepID=UPI003F809225
MSFLDKLKQKAEELDLQTKANQLAEQAKVAAQQAKEKAGELAYENRERIEGLADKAGHAIDERTGGKYGDKITKAKEQVARGVDKVAEGRPVHDVPGPETRTSAPGPVVPPVVSEPDVTTPDVTGAAAPGTGPGTGTGPATSDGDPGVTGTAEEGSDG